MRISTLCVLTTCLLLTACAATPDVGTAPAPDQSASAARGEVLAQTRCSACHAVGRPGASPMAEAPPFRELHKRYPVTFLQEAFAEGLTTAHPAMPEVKLESGEIRDLIAWLESLEVN